MSVQQFRKKPVVIEAYQWFRNGDHPHDNVGEKLTDPIDGTSYERLEGAIVRYFRHPNTPGHQLHTSCGSTWHDHGWIDTLEGGHNVCPSDWIITGVAGEFYPCKAGIFDATYELAE